MATASPHAPGWVLDMLDREFPRGSYLEVGKAYQHPLGRLVKITGGAFWGLYGLSNYFYWREILNEDGRLSDWEEHGYGWDPQTLALHPCPQSIEFKPLF